MESIQQPFYHFQNFELNQYAIESSCFLEKHMYMERTEVAKISEKLTVRKSKSLYKSCSNFIESISLFSQVLVVWLAMIQFAERSSFIFSVCSFFFFLCVQFFCVRFCLFVCCSVGHCYCCVYEWHVCVKLTSEREKQRGKSCWRRAEIFGPFDSWTKPAITLHSSSGWIDEVRTYGSILLNFISFLRRI